MKNAFIFCLSFIACTFLFAPTAFAASYNQTLNSNWLFFEEQLISSSTESEIQPKVVDLPIEFDDLTPNTNTYGTFTKRISIPTNFINKQIAIELPFVYSAAKIYVNGELIEEVGQVGLNEKDHRTDLKSVVIPFKSTTANLEIAIQLSSFDHIRGGFSQSPRIGDWKSIEQPFLLKRYITIFVGTIIFIVGLATLTIGLMNRNEKLFLTFGLFSIDVAIRSLVAVPFIYHDLPFPISYELATRIEYITTTTCFALYAVFIYVLYNKLFSKFVLYFNVSILVSIAVLALFVEPKIFQSVFFNVFPIMISFVLYNIWIMIRALKSKLTLAKSLLLGVLFVFTGLIIDFLTGMGILNVPPLAHFMIALNVLIVLFSLCKNYVQRVQQVTQLNKDLDELVKKRTAQLHEANEELKKLVNIDALTNIYNRHKFNETIYYAFIDAELNEQHLSLMMLDIDEFKSYNDYYGHVSGDELITHIAQLIQSILPEDVLFARYGGEEFVVVLPQYSLTQTAQLAENIRKHIEEQQLENLGRESKLVTISIGCAEMMIDSAVNEKMLVEIADDRLYISKLQGRNRVTYQSIENNEMKKSTSH